MGTSGSKGVGNEGTEGVGGGTKGSGEEAEEPERTPTAGTVPEEREGSEEEELGGGGGGAPEVHPHEVAGRTGRARGARHEGGDPQAPRWTRGKWVRVERPPSDAERGGGAAEIGASGQSAHVRRGGGDH